MNDIAMYSLVILILSIKVKAEATDTLATYFLPPSINSWNEPFAPSASLNLSHNPEIYLTIGNELIQYDYTVLKDKSLKIMLHGIYPRYVWCNKTRYDDTDSQGENFVPETEFKYENEVIKINITNVTTQMSTNWGCTVLRNYNIDTIPYLYKNINYTVKYFHFNLHVKGAVPVLLAVNDLSLTTVMSTNLSVIYDGEANYTYEDGEHIYVSCSRVHNVSALRLEYYNADGILLFTTRDVYDGLIFQSVLKAENNHYYLDCTCITDMPTQAYLYRTTFNLKNQDLVANAEQHAVTMFVNDLQMLPLNKQLATARGYKDYNDYCYQSYRYIDGEVLNIICQKNNENVRGALTLRINDSEIMRDTEVLRTPSMGKIMFSLNTYRLNVDRKTVVCQIGNTDVQNTYVRLPLLSDFPENSLQILGLHRENVLYKYKYSSDQWTIEYQYSVDETLDLTCVGKRDLFNIELQWTFQGEPWQPAEQIEEFNRSQDFYSITSDIIMYNIQFTKKLNETHDKSRIQCMKHILKDVIVEVILHLKPEIKTNETTSNKPVSDYILIYIVSSVSAAGIVILLALVVFYAKKRCTQQQQGLAPLPIDPDSVFYVNRLEILRRQYEMEAAEQDENDYEEIDYQCADTDNHYEEII